MRPVSVVVRLRKDPPPGVNRTEEVSGRIDAEAEASAYRRGMRPTVIGKTLCIDAALFINDALSAALGTQDFLGCLRESTDDCRPAFTHTEFPGIYRKCRSAICLPPTGWRAHAASDRRSVVCATRYSCARLIVLSLMSTPSRSRRTKWPSFTASLPNAVGDVPLVLRNLSMSARRSLGRMCITRRIVGLIPYVNRKMRDVCGNRPGCSHPLCSAKQAAWLD